MYQIELTRTGTCIFVLNVQAGISQHKLMLALEPEVAAVFVKEIQIERQADEMSKYRPGKKFLVMDLGGDVNYFQPFDIFVLILTKIDR